MECKDYKKKKIAILISGSNCPYINAKKIELGYSLDTHVQVLKKQFSDYEIDFYVVFSNEFDVNIFGDNLKAYRIISDNYLRKKKRNKVYKNSYQHLKKKYLIDLIDKSKEYYFYLYIRNDSFLTPHGEGLHDRKVKKEQSMGWKKIPKIDKEYYNLKLKFSDKIDFNYLYLIPYGYRSHIKDCECIFDGFALGNLDNIVKYLNWIYDGKGRCELKLKAYLEALKINLESIDVINTLEPKDEHLQFITCNIYS